MSKNYVPYWRVAVSDDRGQVVAIEPAMLVGRDIGEHEEALIRLAIDQLSAFIGRASYDSMLRERDS